MTIPPNLDPLTERIRELRTKALVERDGLNQGMTKFGYTEGDCIEEESHSDKNENTKKDPPRRTGRGSLKCLVGSKGPNEHYKNWHDASFIIEGDPHEVSEGQFKCLCMVP